MWLGWQIDDALKFCVECISILIPRRIPHLKIIRDATYFILLKRNDILLKCLDKKLSRSLKTT